MPGWGRNGTLPVGFLYVVQMWSCRTTRTKIWKPLATFVLRLLVAAVMVHTGMISVMGQNSFRTTSADTRSWLHEAAAPDSGLNMSLTQARDGDAMISIGELRARTDTPKLAWKLYKTALQEDQKGHQQQARGFAANAVRMAPQFFQAHAALATAYLRVGDLDSAEREIRISLSLNPDYLAGYELRGILLYVRGDITGSAASLSELLKKDPFRRAAHYFLGCALRDLGEDRMAREHFRAAQRLLRRPAGPLLDDDPRMLDPGEFSLGMHAGDSILRLPNRHGSP